ncbi:MAG: hypothetical protein LBH29_04520 [Elusimicrobiota bacterium]|jgi:hypothetical protein|nr:hypothetical protein [Elusimicrobiota bacterium]
MRKDKKQNKINTEKIKKTPLDSHRRLLRSGVNISLERIFTPFFYLKIVCGHSIKSGAGKWRYI